MLRKFEELRHSAIQATDGPIGRLPDVYFDDRTWELRYLVVDTGGWLSGRKVLISPQAIVEYSPDNDFVRLNLTKSQIEGSPDITADEPVSRQGEAALYNYYGWTAYWPVAPTALAPLPELTGPAADREEAITAGYYGGDPNLRSAKEMRGYYVQATDGDIGHIEDFLIDDESSRFRYIVIDTRNWLPGKRVVIPTRWITDVSWAEARITVDVPKEAVRNSPEYNPAIQITSDYENRLEASYGRPLH
ncbi:MAG: PRC-barrel domain-containing protein [Bryobacteraceae bacterium]